MLETRVQIFASQGYSNRREVEEAYRFIGMDPSHAQQINDDHIIGQFRSRLADISPSAVAETRNALRIIGLARKSKQIEEEATNAIETYSQALSWLGLMEDQPDDFVITMYTIKVGVVFIISFFLSTASRASRASRAASLSIMSSFYTCAAGSVLRNSSAIELTDLSLLSPL